MSHSPLREPSLAGQGGAAAFLGGFGAEPDLERAEALVTPAAPQAGPRWSGAGRLVGTGRPPAEGEGGRTGPAAATPGSRVWGSPPACPPGRGRRAGGRTGLGAGGGSAACPPPEPCAQSSLAGWGWHRLWDPGSLSGEGLALSPNCFTFDPGGDRLLGLGPQLLIP